MGDEDDDARVVEARGWDGSWLKPDRVLAVGADVGRAGTVVSGATLYGAGLPDEGIQLGELTATAADAGPALLDYLRQHPERLEPMPSIAPRIMRERLAMLEELDRVTVQHMAYRRAVEAVVVMPRDPPPPVMKRLTFRVTNCAWVAPQPHKRTKRANRRARGRFKAWVRNAFARGSR